MRRMKIALDCPGCGKRYDVAATLAGKKSRMQGMRQHIPNSDAPSGAASAAESRIRPASPTVPRGDESVAGAWIERTPGVHAEVVATSASPVFAAAAGAARGTIVLNCPRCFKRYEVDAALSGKKSRCKDCKEVFTIPPPVPAKPSWPNEQPSPAKKPGLLTRNFAIIPEEVVSEFEDDLEFEPAEAVRRPPPPPPPATDEEPMALAPRRVGYSERGTRSSRRAEVGTELGVTVAGVYVGLGILGFIVLAIWHAAGEPGSEKLGRVFGAVAT